VIVYTDYHYSWVSENNAILFQTRGHYFQIPSCNDSLHKRSLTEANFVIDLETSCF